jgi:sulfite reductase (NADPH) flavoprotein alpha-component
MLGGLVKLFKGKEGAAKVRKKCSKEEAEYILLFGTHSGTTASLAKEFFKCLQAEGKKVFMDELDHYSSYESATHLIVFTATYGVGGPPTNGNYFEDLIQEEELLNPLKFSVVAFGSTSFTEFCQFGVDVDSWLGSTSGFERFLPLVRVSDQSSSDFRSWLSLWNRATNMEVQMKLKDGGAKLSKGKTYSVLESPDLNIDSTALIKLRPKSSTDFQSGDLLSIVPKGSDKPRIYSIARTGDDILLSVKKHERGICSDYLCNLKEGDTLTAHIERNESFHLVPDAPSIWLIGNGTGIAPYLGMIDENKDAKLRLIWGGRTASSFDLYKPYIEKAMEQGRMEKFELALSRDGKKQYVQELLAQQEDQVAKAFESGAVFMLCGSMAMQNEVLEVLGQITHNKLKRSLSSFQNNGQLLKDCY